MFCSSCGKPIEETDMFCSYCGASTNMVPVSRAKITNDLSQENTSSSDSGTVADKDYDDMQATEGEGRISTGSGASLTGENDKKPENPLFSSDDFDEMRKRIAGKAIQRTGVIQCAKRHRKSICIIKCRKEEIRKQHAGSCSRPGTSRACQ